MKQLLLKVGADRSALGILSIGSGGWSVAVSAKSDPVSGLPDPAVGQYRLIRSTQIPDAYEEARRAYGEAMLFFQTGETVIPLHAGDLAESGKLLPTDGGIRLSGEDFQRLIEEISDDVDVRLEIREAAEVDSVAKAAGGKVKVSSRPAPRVSRPAAASSPAFSSSGSTHHHHHASPSDDFWFWYWMLSSDDERCRHHDYPPVDVLPESPAEAVPQDQAATSPDENGAAAGTLPVVSTDFLPAEEVRPPDEAAPPESGPAEAPDAEPAAEADASGDGPADDASGTAY